MHHEAFRDAVVAKDPAALVETLADDVRFRSPVVFRPYEGKELVGAILTEGAMKVLEDFRYVAELEDAEQAALFFEARVGDRDLQGLDLIRFDADGKVGELTVMVRPLSGVNALAEAMRREFERLGIAPPRG